MKIDFTVRFDVPSLDLLCICVCFLTEESRFHIVINFYARVPLCFRCITLLKCKFTANEM